MGEMYVLISVIHWESMRMVQVSMQVPVVAFFLFFLLRNLSKPKKHIPAGFLSLSRISKSQAYLSPYHTSSSMPGSITLYER